MNKIDVVLGLQWGDEGKGKIVDVLAERYNKVARFQGGPNAGHSLHFGGKSFVLRSIPSGIFRDGTTNIIGNGVVFDPIAFKKECDELSEAGVPIRERLVLSGKAHIILPTHRLLDAANEQAAGKGKIGSTLKGIGPCYTDKISRDGLRLGEVFHNFAEKYEAAKQRHIKLLAALGFDTDVAELEKQWFEGIEYIKTFQLIDSEHVINGYLRDGKSVLCEGAQGSLLDVDFGSYPFVTSSNTVCAGACSGLGVAPNKIGEVYGIFKAYCTRVDSGPFPTELHDETGAKIRAIGHEFGAVTGRERRCGWIDLVALRYTIMLNGVTQLIMMKSDVLDDFATIKACDSYLVNGVETRDFPYSIDEGVEPVYTELKGWNTDMTKMQSEDQFPQEFKDYIAFLEDKLGVPITIVSVGPDRTQTIERKH